ncbi:MAG TPA: hypothetical protein VMT76_00925 [Puia sp.]|nr:hypothetical protein [Puia sp.]
MKTAFPENLFIFSAALIFFHSCSKNETRYYPDTTASGVAIFSNKGNNVFSCLINGRPWRTFDRKIGGWGGSSFEVSVRKEYYDSLTDMLIISWQGYFADDSAFGEIQLLISVPPNFSFKDFHNFQGKRIPIDGVTSYFINQTNFQSQQGSGAIYFNQASLDTAAFGYQGRISGLLEADFNSVKLTAGRFDHMLETGQVFFR